MTKPSSSTERAGTPTNSVLLKYASLKLAANIGTSYKCDEKSGLKIVS